MKDRAITMPEKDILQLLTLTLIAKTEHTLDIGKVRGVLEVLSPYLLNEYENDAAALWTSYLASLR